MEMVVLDSEKMDLFVASQRSQNTRVAYKQDLDAFTDWMSDEPVLDEETVIRWRNYIENSLSNASALRRFTTVRSFYRWLDAGQSPLERVKAPRRIQSWTPVVPDEADIDKILRVCDNPRDYAILVLLNNGLRAQEVCDLNVEDVYFDTTYGRTIMRVTGKGMKMRLVPANRQTVQALRRYEMPATGRLFRNLNIRKVYYAVARWAKAAKVEGIHPHALRHGYATRLARSKVSVFSMQRLLGHTRPETTGIYVNLDLGDLIAATESDPRDRSEDESGDNRIRGEASERSAGGVEVG